MIGPIILALTVTFGAVRAQTGCDTKADVTFLLDSSSNVGQQNFQKQLNFIKDVTNNMQIAPDKVQVSAVTFGTGVTNQFYLNQYTDKTAVEQAIMNIPYKGGSPQMANAIRFATGTSFSPVHGGRGDAPHVAVILTNQPSGTIDQIKLESQTARDNGLILYTVGIGNGVDQHELQTIASDPDIRHMFQSQNFDALGSISDLLATKICNELPPDPTMLAAPTGCLTKADLVFMIDSSSSVGSTNFQKLEHFLKDVVSKIDVGQDKVQVGVVKYGSYPSIEFPLGQYSNRPETMKAIEGMTYLGGGTNDADAIRYTGDQVFSQYSGARGNVPRIAVLITDGGSANAAAAVAAADKARTQNIGLIAIGVGNRVNTPELNKIADSPSSENAFTIRSYDDLDTITDKLIAQMCKVKSSQPSITTAAPGATLPPDPCQDAMANCAQYGNDVCTNYPSWAHQNCAKFCGFCTPLYTFAPPKCEDTLPDCSNYGREYCAQTTSYVAQNCELFCGFCGANTSTTGYYGKCSYKSKTYSTGEKWYDGCDYECVCEDGNTGRYKCNNRCPVYYNLPRDCTLVAQPGECCLQPVCNFNPAVNTLQSSGHGVTVDGIDVCVYKGKQYFQRQSWRDGCDFQCTCIDAKSGLYTCDEFCPTYNSIPPYCHLEQPAGECCKKPICEFDSQTGSYMGTGSISGYGVGAKPTEHPPCIDAISTCNMYGRDVCVSYRGWAAINCRKYCNMCPDGLPQPGPNDQCVYGGKLYKQGDTWSTSCDTTCTCENAIYGYYRCENTCPTYNNLPNTCQVVKTAGQCCPTVQCVNGFFLTSSMNPGTIGNGGAINITNPMPGIMFVAPTTSTGGTPRPGTGGTGFQAPALNGCLYKGQLYVQDQSWEDGCEYSCICKEAGTGLYSCQKKCPSYPALPPSCHLETDVNDECCLAPKCVKDPVTQVVPIPLPVFMPATQMHAVVMPPSIDNNQAYTQSVTLFPTGFTPAPPTPPSSGGTGGIGYCTYRGQRYQPGQVWEDGCDFNCVCDDATRGHYTCTEKCVHYPVLPKQCYLIKDPENPCCDIPKCNFQVNYVTHQGEVKITTARPLGEFCIYEGQQYQQGQTWYDGCSFKCTCENAAENTYRCLTRCPEYENVGEDCDFLPDPKDPSCCVMPKCPTASTSSPGVTSLPTPAPTGSFIGQGTGTGYCDYKETRYVQGQSWQDGCDFNCVCTDAESGLYRCTEICQRYNNLPPYCTLVTDFTNPCCKKPRCDFSAVTQAIVGTGAPTSTLVPTPLPPGQTPVPHTGSTLAPHYLYCVYKGVQYTQGETWEDGCQYRCRCDDADKGLYVCNERCATYDSVPADCTMVTDPRDSCCLVPSCVPKAQTTPAPIPGVSTPVPTPYQIPTAPPGAVTGSANVPTPKPGMTPQPLNYCEYKGSQYMQGQKWDDGCDFTCECIDDNTGRYKCLEKCARYVNLPANCRLSKDPANPCCQVPECSGEPTPAPPTTPGPHYTLGPPTQAPKPPNVCVYKGNYYTQGQQWYDGCDYVCVCENSMEGLYTCNERCPQYGSLPAECKMVQSSSDPLCCKEPKCVFENTKNVTGGYLTPPTPPPGVIYGGAATPTPPPTMAPSPGYSPTPGPSTTPAPQVCIYKGNMYQQGQQWQDGCNYNCECIDSMSGQYKCTEVCPKMDDIPAGCRMITDPYNPCCKKAYCPAALVPTPAPPGVSTPAPTPQPKSGCMYNGVRFSQGEHWNDGCDLQCICEDEMSGFYRCNDRCSKYDVPEECTLVTDPRDSCCKVPYCPTPTTPAPWYPGMVPTPAPGFTYAPDKVPTPAPGSTYPPGMFPTWVPGMVPTPAPGVTYAPNKLPTPAPGLTYAPGLYPTWVPGMEPTPAPGVTYAPDKIPTPAPGSTFAPGMFPTWVPGMVPTPMPGQTFAPNKIPTPAPGSTYPPGMFPTWVPGMVPTPAPGVTYAPDKIPTPAPGLTYPPMLFPTWVPGMVPTPAPGITYAPWRLPTPAPGSTYAPGMFPTWVPGMEPTPAPGMTYAPDKIPTPAPGSTYPPGMFPTWVPGMVPTPAPGVTYAPDKIPTPAPGLTYPPMLFPTWVPGMVPTPAPGITFAPWKLPTPAPYSTYAPGMFPTWVPGMVPTPAPGMTYAPDKIPTPAPGSTYPPGMFPTWVPGMVPTPAPGVTYAPNKIPTPAPGSTYAPGMFPTWVPGMVPTPAPGFTYPSYLVPTPAPGQTYAPGMFPTITTTPYPTPGLGQTYPPWNPGMVPTPAPGSTYAPYLIPTPAPGSTYAPGMFPTWVPGMVPTPAPGQTFAPWLIPGITPAVGSTYAPFKYPTWVPGMVPTPAPGVTFAPDKIPTPAPGSTYLPGLYPTWVPGMVPTPMPGQTFAPDKLPTPAPGSTYPPGLFPTWVPGMVPTPAPGVTYAPDKIPTPAPGSTYAPLKFPTWVPGMVPTPAPGVTYAPNKLPTPYPGMTYAPGLFPTWVPGMVPTPQPGMTFAPDKIPTPAPGSTYPPGMYPTWVPGMVPTPAPGVTYAPWLIPTPAPGSTYPPGQIPTWVPGMVPTPAPGQTYAPDKIPTPAPGQTYAPLHFPTWVPGMIPTPAPGQTFAPNKIPTPAPGSTYPPGLFPTWVPGMVPTPAPGVTYAPDKIPTPAPGSTYPPGLFPTWVPGMVPTPAPGVTYAPDKIPTPAPYQTYQPGMFPTWVPGMVPTPAPGVTYAPDKIPTPAPGSTYAPGKFPTWVPGMVPTPAPGFTYPPYLIPTPGGPGQTYAPGMFPVITTTPYPTPAPGQTYPPWNPGMVPTPAPGQTYAPDVIPTPAPGSTYAPGMFPTWVPGMIPTGSPGQTLAPWLIPGITPAVGSTYAPFKYPTWVPGMVPTPAPGVTFAPDKIPTPAPGSTYLPGLYPTWVPGMVPTPMPGQTFAPDKLPTPAPGSTYAPGLFPTWVPGMVPTPAPGVTYAPDKIPTPAPGSTYPPGMYPTWVPGMVPTPAPGVTYAPWMIPTPAPGSTFKPGMFPTWVPGMVPTPAPGMTYAPDKIPTPAPGSTYKPGMFPTWVPGMVPTPAPGVTYAPDKIPTPAPGSTYPPGMYPTWVPGMVPTPAPGSTYPPFLIPTPAPGQTYAPGMFPAITTTPYPTPAPGKTYPPWNPGMVPTPAPGQTYAPDLIPTPAVGSTYAPGMFPTWVPGMVPTPTPGQTYAPWLIPGFTPAVGSTYAPFKYPTWVPGMVPTPAPGVTFAPNMIPTPAPGSTYPPGMFPTWVPGMVPTPMPGQTFAPDKVPTPAPGSTYAPGLFPTWVPGMVPTPAPGVTYAPDKIPTPAPGYTYGPLQFPTWVPGMVPTPAPGVTYSPEKIPTPHPGQTYAPGLYPTWIPGMVPTPQPGMTFAPDKIPTPAPGSTYAPGMYPTWVPGMVPTPMPGYTYAPDKIPTPGPGLTYAPGMYPTWVPGMVPTPGGGGTYAPDKLPTPYPGVTYPPGMYPTWVPGMVPTPQPGMTYAPDKIPTPAPGSTYPPGMYPTWVPGMVPTPMPGYTYAPDKIPTPGVGLTYAPGMFPTWVPGMVPTPAPGMTYSPDKIPTPGPGLTYAPGQFPTPAPNPYPVPTAMPGTFQGSGVNGNKSGCVHYGVVYNAGQTWQDGCKYDCECLDEHTGRYQCKERCPLFLNIPSYCRLVVDPNDACCKIPVCQTPTPAPPTTPAPNPLLTPTPAPGQSTPIPGLSVSGQPGLISGTGTPPPMPIPGTGGFTGAPKNVCVMNGVQYVAGQTWYDGCNQRCVCEDGMTGFYRCFDRCASYPTVPTGCKMVPDPKDPTCCEVPQCIPIPGPGQTVPTGGPLTVTGVPGVISGSGTPPMPSPGTGGFTSAPKNVCVYQGRMYTQGQSWQDGCQYNCVCTDGMTGKYECTERCAAFPLVPPECKLQRDPKDVCCFVPVCDYNQLQPTLPAPVSPGVSTQLPPLPPSYCVYKGVTYGQGQTWDDGCTKKCRCDDADMNIYTCFDRCTSYNNLGAGCVMVSDPNDACCVVPQCTYVPTSGPAQPGSTPPTVCPYPMPTAVPGVITGGPQPDPVTGVQPSNIGYCDYRGQQYRQGQSWDDGCSFTCTCIDSNSGQYQCVEKCPRYVGIPSYCKMAEDPNNKCCQKPACNVCPQTPAPPTGTGPTPSAGPTPAPKEVCIMSGNQYTEGQKWYEGCDKICVCDDGKTGHYTCKERCPSYPLQPGCTMVPDPRDPVCCQTPSCPGNPGVYGQLNGSGTPTPLTIPNPIPGSTMVAPSQPPPMCVYNGKMYAQGQKWQDGCQYECVCDNAMTGHYICTDRCPRFPNLPSTCHLVYDPMDPCCQKKECTDLSPTPGPGLTPTPGPSPSTDFCVYQGVPFRQGQSFNQGCDKICKCEDAVAGTITCNDRCPTYPALTPNCTLTTDPRDQCCQIPTCTTPTGVVGVPGYISGSNIPTSTNPMNPTGTRNGCVFNGHIYQQGQTWDDGCSLTCECLDATSGRYRCTEKCPRMPPLPSYCTLTQDPVNPCCQTPFCQPLTSPGPTLAPNPMLTPAPPQNVCVYKGSTYQQGQQWYDGCDSICRCDDASKDFYSCKQRCAAYTSVASGCTLVPDPQDPTCCEVPSCPILPGLNPTPGIITAAPQPGGVIFGTNPTAPPGSTLPPPYRSGCAYKGQLFHQGQKFDDGCDYECECLDDMTGQYKCVEKCQKYSKLPTECILVQDPNKPCCQVPFCDFTNPTPFPAGVPTPAPIPKIPTPAPGVATVAPYVIPGLPSTPRPGVNQSPTPQPSFTISPTVKPQGYCVYKGVYYTQGQTWDDGCDKQCRCEDVLKGYYTCNQRCASYPVSNCPLKADPADSCCLIPDCNTGNIPTPIPTPHPGQSTINPFVTPKPVSGTFTGSSGGNPVVVPFQPGSQQTGSASACVYKTMIYTQGQTWHDGCNYNCECVDASRGQYRCTDRCPKYPYLPPQCHFKQSSTDACCQEPECNTYIQPTTLAPITVKPGFNTGPSGSNPTHNPPSLSPDTVCMYTDGTQYAQGAKWTPSCDQECECTDAAKNIFECKEQCPVYSGLPSFCTLQPDPSNSCCMQPVCTLPSGITLTPLTGTATPPPKSLQVLPVGTHEVITGYSKPQPGQIIVGGRDQCVYQGTLHPTGTSWDDGCDFVCTCENGATGMYRCTAKCPQFPSLPNYCKLVTVPGQCCKSLTCDIPGVGTYNPVPQLVPTPRPSGPVSGTTSNPQLIYVPEPVQPVGGGFYPGGGFYLPNATSPDMTGSLRDKCVYKNRLYNQGEQWQDGCDYSCECMDSRTGYYVCNPLCPVYNNLPSQQCYLVKADGQCCSQPMCYDPNKNQVVNPLNSNSVFPVVGTYTGGFTGFRPYSSVGGNLGNRNTCVYKGTIYHKNDKWDDGCDFTCTCLDETTGTYSCSAKCPSYTNIPPVCHMVPQAGSCCQRVECNQPSVGITLPQGPTQTPPTTAQPKVDPNCHDNIDNCKDYGIDACGATYKDWAVRNCNLTCGFCNPMFTTAPPQCIDKLSDCKDYGLQACSGIYEPWALDNCRQYCGLCTTTAPLQPSQSIATVQSGGSCVDALGTCDLLDPQFYCVGDYYSWALQNCQKTCNLCSVVPTTPTTPPPVTVAPQWLMLLKGVAGAPGPDLYQLWYSGQTLNQNVPQAQTHTASYNGHYKPDYSNHWQDLCIDQIKVAIYNQGVEKANIIFNATGADKLSWFTNDRIISSTWTDIKTAPKEIFSMPGDASKGREFYISGQSDKSNDCDSFGWIMVSTKPACFYETTDPKPAFYYAPGTSQAHWGFTNPGTGDVFVIEAQSRCPPGSQTGQPTNFPQTTKAAICEYKGKQYTQSQYWTDGCQYNCTCEDAAIGYYRCRNLCPQYTNLPPGCKLITNPGDCCAQPDCGMTQVSTIAPLVIVGGTSFCSYKGQYYTQDQTWNDGCSQACTCTNADQGMYSCRSVCLNWNTLPAICHLEDAPPGLCCQQPRCPSGVIINIPKVYKDQYPGYNYVLCEYKGNTYTQGQQWTDGCQYNCTCEDGAIGYYRCRTLCPQYMNLPPGCKLITTPGDCCAQPDCAMSQAVITIAPIIFVPGTSFCSYKGQFYTQDQTWNDGCSQTCTCTNADQGMYSCRSVCLNWNTLPSICHLEDAPPGLCCQQPRCPSGVIINIPKSYKDQYPGYNYV